MAEWDHAFLLAEEDDLDGCAERIDAMNRAAGTAVVRFPAPPSAEVMAAVLAAQVASSLEAPVELESVTIWETDEFSATVRP